MTTRVGLGTRSGALRRPARPQPVSGLPEADLPGQTFVLPVLAALVLAAGVLVVDPRGWNPFGPAKWSAELIAAALAGAALLGAGRLRMARRATVAWAVFLLLVVVSALRGLDPTQAWTGTPQRHFGALTWFLCAGMFVAGQSLRDRRAARIVAGAAVAVAGLAGAWGVAESIGWSPLAVAGNRVTGPLGNASYLGAAESLLLPVAVGVAADRIWSVKWRVGAGIAGGLALTALVASGARAAWVGALAAGAVLVVVRGRALRTGSFGPRRLAVAGLLAVLAVVGLAFATGTAGRVPDLFRSGQTGGSSRVAEWETAWKVVAHHPLTGVGPEGYRIAFVQDVSGSYVQRYGLDPLPDRAHNSLLDVAATLGLPGLAAYMVLLGLVLVFVVRALRRAPPWLAGVAAGVIAYLVGSLFLFPLAEVDPSMWLLAGLTVGQVSRRREVSQVTTPSYGALALIFGTAVLAVLGVKAVMADDDMKSALVASAQGSIGATRADRLVTSAVRLDPGNIVIRLGAAEIQQSAVPLSPMTPIDQVTSALSISRRDPVLGREMAQLLVNRAEATGAGADWSRCDTFLSGLLRRDPRDPSVLLDAGVVATHQGRLAEAERQLSEAARLAPRSPQPEADLALLYEQEGRTAASHAAAQAALRLDPEDAAARTVINGGGSNGT